MAHTNRLLIEQWLPIETIGTECMRDASTAKKPPLNRLHVWWARRPLTVSRAAILASILPAYPTEDDPDARPWPSRFRTAFPTFDSYKAWFVRLIGIQGDPVAGKKLIEWAKKENKKLNFNPYGYPRAFTINPNEEQLEQLYDLLEWTWGTREITFCDPMAGGGSIPFEALRYGLTVRSNELNPVASVILKATLDYPARFGPSLADDIRKYGRLWCDRVRERLEPFFPLASPAENVFAYIWARTVPCPVTGKPVPLSPNWWLKKLKGSPEETHIGLRLIANEADDKIRFQIVRGLAAKRSSSSGTIKGGSGRSPWCDEPIDGRYIKKQAQEGSMREQLIAVGIKSPKGLDFREPNQADYAANAAAEKEVERDMDRWVAEGLVPNEEIDQISNYDRGHRLYGAFTWADFFSPRQTVAAATILEAYNVACAAIDNDGLDAHRATAIKTYLAFCVDKSIDYNCRFTRFHSGRGVVANKFDKHNYAFKWSYAEFDAPRNLTFWTLDQVIDSYTGISKLVSVVRPPLLGERPGSLLDRLNCTKGPAQDVPTLDDRRTDVIVVDPPYYRNVMYAECSDFFYVWMKRTLGNVYPGWFVSLLSDKDDEAVANDARFAALGVRTKKQLADKDYEKKMQSCFAEMYRTLADSGVLTVMFTHREVSAWDTLGTALLAAGFRVDSSWPVHTESEHSTHQANKNAAASTILLACRKREAPGEPAWWDDLKGQVKETARATAQRFEKEGIRGVDLYISTFGPVLSIISEHWPVLTSNADPRTGDPIPLQPGEALDLARREVINLRKQGLLLGRSVEFDPVTDWYLMAWDAFRAQQFPADEARKLALALGLDLEANLVRDKRLVTKKGKNVSLALPPARRKRGVVDPEAEGFPHLIDALHTAMMVYEEDGSRACQAFIDRQGLRNDSRTKALAQAAMQAIPTTRGKDGNFLRPEMTTLDALRLLVWEDLPAPPEEEVPEIETQLPLFQRPSDEAESDGADEPPDEEAEEDDEEPDDE